MAALAHLGFVGFRFTLPNLYLYLLLLVLQRSKVLRYLKKRRLGRAQRNPTKHRYIARLKLQYMLLGFAALQGLYLAHYFLSASICLSFLVSVVIFASFFRASSQAAFRLSWE